MIPIDEIKNHYGIEIALVVLCCRIPFKTEPAETIQPFIDANEIDWEHFFLLTDYHRIEPIVFKVLENANLPEAHALKIKQRRIHLVQQNIKRALETERIILELEEKGVNCFPYKGVSYSLQFYGDLFSRESSDIDLVLLPADFDVAKEVLLQSGYSFENKLEFDYYKADIFHQEKSLDFNRYQNSYRESRVEFHWRISTNTTQIKKEANALLFEPGTVHRLVKNQIKLLKPEAHFLSIFIHHAFNDGFSALRNLIDIAQPTNKESSVVDKTFIQQAIQDFHLMKAWQTGQFLVKELLGLEFALDLQNQKLLSSKERRHFISRLLSKQLLGSHLKIRPYSKSILYQKDTARDKLIYLLACFKFRFTPSPKDLRLFKIPRKYSFLYAVLKPFRSLFFRVSDEEKKRIARDSAG